MNRKTLLLIFTTVITGCISFPTTVKLHDSQPMVIATDSETGRNLLFENTLLDHYNVDGQDTYCINLMTTRTDAFHCFAHNNGTLTHGMDPASMKWVPLPEPVEIKTINK